jgi:cold shock CspA family protein
MSAESSHRSRSRSPAARRSHSPRRGSRSPPRRSSRSPPRHSSRSRSRSPPRAGARLTGLALRWNPKGFGFIKPDDGSEDVFCHTTAIKDGNALREGDKVEYEKVFDDRQQKDRAQNVTGGCQVCELHTLRASLVPHHQRSSPRQCRIFFSVPLAF